MEFLKNHYEKILLSVVLVLLTGAAGTMPFLITQSQEKIETATKSPRIVVKQYESISLDERRQELGQLQEKVQLDLPDDHNLLNPVPWKQRPDGSIYPVTQENPKQAIEILEITPLYMRVRFLGVRGSGDAVQYNFGITLEAAAAQYKSRRSERRRVLDINVAYSDHPFVLREVEGTPQNPTSFTLVISDTGEQITVTPSQPFERIDGYKADLRVIAPSERTYRNLYRGDRIAIGDQTYNIVAIDENEVTVANTKSGKRTTVRAGGSN